MVTADRNSTCIRSESHPTDILIRAETSLSRMKDHLEALYAKADFLQDTQLSGSTMPDPVIDQKEARLSILIDSLQLKPVTRSSGFLDTSRTSRR